MNVVYNFNSKQNRSTRIKNSSLGHLCSIPMVCYASVNGRTTGVPVERRPRTLAHIQRLRRPQHSSKSLRPDCWFTEIIWLDDAFKASQDSFCPDSIMSLHKVALHCIKTSLKHLTLKLACSYAPVLYVLHSCNTTVACLACRPAARER